MQEDLLPILDQRSWLLTGASHELLRIHDEKQRKCTFVGSRQQHDTTREKGPRSATSFSCCKNGLSLRVVLRRMPGIRHYSHILHSILNTLHPQVTVMVAGFCNIADHRGEWTGSCTQYAVKRVRRAHHAALQSVLIERYVMLRWDFQALEGVILQPSIQSRTT